MNGDIERLCDLRNELLGGWRRKEVEELRSKVEAGVISRQLAFREVRGQDLSDVRVGEPVLGAEDLALTYIHSDLSVSLSGTARSSSAAYLKMALILLRREQQKKPGLS